MTERINRTIVSIIKTIIINLRLSVFLWIELIKTVVCIRNRALIKVLKNKIFEEVWINKKSDFSKIKIIDLVVYYYNIETQSKRQKKFDLIIKKCRLMRYELKINQYRI